MFLPKTLSEDDRETLQKYESSEMQKLTNRFVQAFIVLNQKRMPIKRADLVRIVMADVKNQHHKQTNALINNASKDLYKTFGFRVYFLDDKTRYLLVNAKPSLPNMIEQTDKSKNEISVLFLVLVSIFASPLDRVPIDKIQSDLAEMDLKRTEIDQLLDTFVKRMYLQIEKEKDIKHYCWGMRSKAEIDPDQFIQLFLELGSYKEAEWPNLMRKIEQLKKFQE